MGCIGIILFFIIAIIIGMLFTALFLSVAGCWFFNWGFVAAWHAIWAEPFKLFILSLWGPGLKAAS